LTTDAKLHAARHSHLYSDVPEWMRVSDHLSCRIGVPDNPRHTFKMPWTDELERWVHDLHESGVTYRQVAVMLEERTGVSMNPHSISDYVCRVFAEG
jgi:hypothetical protein